MLLKVFFIGILFCHYSVSKRCKMTRTRIDFLCDCTSRHFRSVPRNIPEVTTILDLSNNSLTLIKDNSFHWLNNLRRLIIRSSGVTFMELDAFYGLHNLRELDMNSNFLESDPLHLPAAIFGRIPNLILLDIASNCFHISKQYPDKALRYLSKLETLRIDGINGARFGKGFRSLTRLTNLHVFPCNIRELKNETLIHFNDLPIKTIFLRCQLKRVQAGVFEKFQSLEALSIVNNYFIRISDLLVILSGLKDRNMTLIDFSSNHRAHSGSDILTAAQFSYLGNICVREVSLRSNQLSIIQSGSISVMKYTNCLEKLDISENNIYGDVGTAFELFKLSNLKVIIASEQNPAIHKFVVKHIEERRNSNVTKRKRTDSQTFAFALPPKLEEIYGSNIRVSSTPLINVNFSFGDNVVLFDLNWVHFDSCDGKLNGLNYLQIFKMSGFNCTNLNPEMITSFKNLRELESQSACLNQGFKKDVNGEFLKGLNFLQTVDFTGNFLEILHPDMFQSQYDSLCSINLSNNKFHDIPIEISKFSKLRSINLMDNRITYLKEKTTKDLESLNERSGQKLKIFLSRNDLQCNCQSLQFIKWIFQTNISLDNNRNYSCLYIDGSRKTTVYAYQNIKYLTKQCVSMFWLILSICLTVAFIISIVISSIAYKYRITLHYWYLHIRRKYRLYSKLDDESKEYKYTVFVAYHHDDYRWVCGPLLSFLEMEKKLSLCLHDRDFPPGVLIADNIFDAISQSRKVVLVISRTFLESSWCEYELDLARMRMFRENRELLIVILIDQIKTEEMPTSLLQIWNKITCLEADESIMAENNPNYEHLFWKRLYESILI